MKSRKNFLKFRKNQFKWKKIGWHSDSKCPKCVQKTIFQIYRYDAWCCTACNEWLEEPCADPGCPFCGKRPQTPYEAYFMEDTEAGSAGLRKRWRQSNYQHKADGRERNRRHRELIDKLSDLHSNAQ